MKEMRRKLQTIYQDPYESLDPRMTVLDIVSEPLVVHGIGRSRGEREEMVARALEDVEMSPPEEFLKRYPHELSGGQRQRVAVARALVLGPEFIVADEPVSMLDVSIRAEVLNLMLKLRKVSGISFLFIAHDLALVKHVCDRLAIMYLGKIVDEGPVEDVVNTPVHPYTEALVAAVPVPDPAAERTKVIIGGEIPSPMNPPPGCRFHPRCPISLGICREEEPELIEVSDSHLVACHVRAGK
jgi:peptide/nickel transport system ATP-binding protein